jgi:hypothetical protein
MASRSSCINAPRSRQSVRDKSEWSEVFLDGLQVAFVAVAMLPTVAVAAKIAREWACFAQVLIS